MVRLAAPAPLLWIPTWTWSTLGRMSAGVVGGAYVRHADTVGAAVEDPGDPAFVGDRDPGDRAVEVPGGGAAVLTWSAVTGATDYRVYVRRPDGDTRYWTVTTTSFMEDNPLRVRA